jgi:hypothetical protein
LQERFGIYSYEFFVLNLVIEEADDAADKAQRADGGSDEDGDDNDEKAKDRKHSKLHDKEARGKD